uniref:leukotriene B4 receptor 1-like n=1 Tax=Epinephelus lanceolatus TaxID=310571 RepID=UPI0014461F0D|nr:leukotriene B4 receptor 1-like [Epinephelus lanceolatus]
MYVAIITGSVHNVQLLCQQVCSMEQLNSSVVTSNISSSPGHPPPASWDSSGLVPAVVLSVCFLLGVPGNIAVIILRPNWENMSSLSQILMLNLAISDLLCLITLPLWIYTRLYGWNLGLVACKLLTYLALCSIYCSMLTVMVLSVQRYLQVVRLQKFLDQRGRRRLVVLLWLVAMILSISRLVVRQLATNQHWTSCQSSFSSEAQQVAVQLTETLIGFISISVVAFSYIGLYRTVDQAAFFNNPQTTRLVTSIIVTFFVLWMPYYIVNVLGVAGVLLKNESLMKFFVDNRNIAAALTFVNSCLNPLLYAFASRNMCTVCQQREH